MANFTYELDRISQTVTHIPDKADVSALPGDPLPEKTAAGFEGQNAYTDLAVEMYGKLYFHQNRIGSTIRMTVSAKPHQRIILGRKPINWLRGDGNAEADRIGMAGTGRGIPKERACTKDVARSKVRDRLTKKRKAETAESECRMEIRVPKDEPRPDDSVKWVSVTREAQPGYTTVSQTMANTPLTGTATISGTNAIVQTLTAVTGSLVGGSGAFSYQWQADGTNVGTNSVPTRSSARTRVKRSAVLSPARTRQVASYDAS